MNHTKNPPPRWVLAADCRTELPKLAPDSIDLVLTDPPYFLHKMDAAWSHAGLNRGAKKSTGTVKGLPAGMKFDPNQGKRLYDFLLPVCAELARVLKPGHNMLCFSSPRLAHRTASAMEDAGIEVMDLLYWLRPGQSKAFRLNRLIDRSKLAGEEKSRAKQELSRYAIPMLRPGYETIIWGRRPGPMAAPETSGNNAYRCPREKLDTAHMTPKPAALLQSLIRDLAPRPPGTVLDPFAGTGTAGVAARREGYAFIGYEIDPDMAQEAETRVEQATAGQMQLNLD